MAKDKDDELDQLLDRMIKGKTPEQVLGEGGLLKDLTKRLVERMLSGELTEHLGYEPHAPEGRGSGNSRNGTTPKRVLTENGELDLEVPRDRAGEFEPQVVKKGQRRLPGFDEKVIALYARGLSTRDIQGHLLELYGVEVSPSLISTVTDAVIDDVRAWQARPLEACYPILYLDAIHLRVRDGGSVQPGRRTWWGCGWASARARSSGSTCSPRSRTAVCRTCWSRAWMA